MNNNLLIFDLGGGFNDMIKTLISIIDFTSKHSFQFTIRYCTCRPQDNTKTVPEVIKKNCNRYEVTNLFDEKTFLIYDNYVSYHKIKDEVTKENSYDFHRDKIMGNLFNADKKLYMDDITKNLSSILKKCDKKYIIVSSGFCFYAKTCRILEKWNKEFYDTLIPNEKIIDEYNNIMKDIHEPYNFIHYRYEEDMRGLATKTQGEYYTPPLDVLLENNLFKNNTYKIYVATSTIEQLHDKNLMQKEVGCYPSLLYKKSNLDYFDENAWVDFKIGIGAEEIFGFSSSGFSDTLNRLKGTRNYYDKISQLHH